MKTNNGFYSLYFILLIALTSCDRNFNKFKADWIVIELNYQGRSLMDSIGFRNAVINPGNRCALPLVYAREFYDLPDYLSHVGHFWNENSACYVFFDSRSYFRDTFEVKCVGENCCELLLINDDKFVRAVYSGELGLTTRQNRRECALLEDIIPELIPTPQKIKK